MSDLLNQLDDEGKSPLYISIEKGNFGIAFYLLQNGPTPAVLNAVEIKHGYSLLHAALAAILDEPPLALIDMLLKSGTSS